MKQDSSVNLFEILAKFLEFYQFISEQNELFYRFKALSIDDPDIQSFPTLSNLFL